MCASETTFGSAGNGRAALFLSFSADFLEKSREKAEKDEKISREDGEFRHLFAASGTALLRGRKGGIPITKRKKLAILHTLNDFDIILKDFCMAY